MINFVKGELVAVGQDGLVIEVGGVGLRLVVGKRLLEKYNCRVGQSVKIWTHMKVNDDEVVLFGFIDQLSVDFFRKLMGVSGVGPRSALSIMDLGEIHQVGEAIDKADVDYLAKAVGVGKKTAQRIIVELKGKLVMQEQPTIDSDVSLALEGLGFKKSEYADLIDLLPDDIDSVEQRVTWFLKKLGKR